MNPLETFKWQVATFVGFKSNLCGLPASSHFKGILIQLFETIIISLLEHMTFIFTSVYLNLNSRFSFNLI